MVGVIPLRLRLALPSMPVSSGLNLRLRASDIAQADGAVVATWPDTSGSGNAFSYASGGDAILCLTGALDNRAYVNSDTTTLTNAGFSINKQACSFLIVLEYQNVSATAYTLNGGSLDVVLINTSDVLQMFGSGTTTLSPSTRRLAILVTMGTGNVKVYLDASANVQSLTAYGAGSVTGLSLGGAGPLSAKIFDVVGWNRELNSTEAASLLDTWAPAVYATGATASVPAGRAIFDGDSITFGLGATKGRNWPFYLGVASSWLTYDCGQSGNTWANIIARDSVSFLHAGASNWLFTHGGTNDLAGGTSLATMQANVATYTGDAVTAGFSKSNIVLFTLSAGNLGAGGTVRNAYNTWLRSNYTTYAGWLVDVQADVDLGSDASGAHNNGAYWSDGAHYNDAGYVKFAALVRSTVTGLPF